MLLVLGYCLATSIYRAWLSAKVPIVFIVGVFLGGLATIWYWLQGGTKEFMFEAYSNLFICASKFAETGNEQGFPLLVIGNSLFLLATLTLVFSVWQSMLDLPHQLIERGGGDAKTTLQRKSEEIVWYLYVGSALLVASVVVLHSYYSWPAPLMEDHSELRNLATIIAMFYGTGFSLLLLFVLGPAVIALKFRTLGIARNQVGEGDRRADRSVDSGQQLETDGIPTRGSGFSDPRATPRWAGSRFIALRGWVIQDILNYGDSPGRNWRPNLLAINPPLYRCRLRPYADTRI